jgi:hypothetical protein
MDADLDTVFGKLKRDSSTDTARASGDQSVLLIKCLSNLLTAFDDDISKTRGAHARVCRVESQLDACFQVSKYHQVKRRDDSRRGSLKAAPRYAKT